MARYTRRFLLQGIGLILLATLAFLFWNNKKVQEKKSAALRGEEVYASHDCTDCHLAVHILREKAQKREVGLIRSRTDFDELVKFLQTDARHTSFVMMDDKDRSDLIAYLRLQLH